MIQNNLENPWFRRSGNRGFYCSLGQPYKLAAHSNFTSCIYKGKTHFRKEEGIKLAWLQVFSDQSILH